MTSSADDLTPLCQLTTGIAVNGLPTKAGTGQTLKVDATKTALGPDGIAVYYKGNNAVFIKCERTGSTTAVNSPDSPVPYIGKNYADPDGASYHSVLP